MVETEYLCMQSQYLQCWPIFLKTSEISPGMLSGTHPNWCHLCIIQYLDLLRLCAGEGLFTRLLEFITSSHLDLIFPPGHLVITFALIARCSIVLEKKHSLSQICSWMVARSCARRMFLYHLCMPMFLGKIVRVSPLPWLKVTPHDLRMLYC